MLQALRFKNQPRVLRLFRVKIDDLLSSELSKVVEGQRVLFAVDVAKEKFFAAIMTPDKEVHVTLNWLHPDETRRYRRHP